MWSHLFQHGCLKEHRGYIQYPHKMSKSHFNSFEHIPISWMIGATSTISQVLFFASQPIPQDPHAHHRPPGKFAQGECLLPCWRPVKWPWLAMARRNRFMRRTCNTKCDTWNIYFHLFSSVFIYFHLFSSTWNMVHPLSAILCLYVLVWPKCL